MVKPVFQPARRIGTPLRGRGNTSEIGLGLVQIRRILFEPPGSPGLEQQGNSPLHGSAQIGPGPDGAEPMDVNDRGHQVEGEQRGVRVEPDVHVAQEGMNGDKVDLAEWIDPVVPGPHQGPVEEDSDGWNLIDLWDVWDCTLCEFPTM